jgi:peroxiredoxin
MIRRLSCLVSTLVVASLFLVSVAVAEVAPGDKAPSFSATGVDGKQYSLADFKDAKATVVIFTCNNCPVARAYEDRFIDFTKANKDKGVAVVAINVNVSEDLERMKQRAEDKGFNFPYVYDASGASAKAYGATVTPHLYLLDSSGKVAYVGSFDDKQNGATKNFLQDATDAVLSGKTPAVSSTKAFGCGIKPAK